MRKLIMLFMMAIIAIAIIAAPLPATREGPDQAVPVTQIFLEHNNVSTTATTAPALYGARHLDFGYEEGARTIAAARTLKLPIEALTATST